MYIHLNRTINSRISSRILITPVIPCYKDKDMDTTTLKLIGSNLAADMPAAEEELTKQQDVVFPLERIPAMVPQNDKYR